MKIIKFTAKVSPWNIGESAGFEDQKAADLVSRGIAVYLDDQPVQSSVEVVETVVRRPGRPPRQF
jgi:hypothetical protein